MAISNKTYNNVINTLKNVGNLHEQITTVTSGDIWQVNLEKNELFPVMHINPVNVQTGQSQLNYNFQIFVMDLVSEDENWTESNFQSANFLNNNQEVLSETLQICIDIISMLRQGVYQSSQDVDDINSPEYWVEQEYSLEPFSERFDNEVTGWVFTINVLVQNDFQSCEIPVIAPQGAGE
tara:strand:+ start:11063 stop:11602 length:540 start_codon:yes stop_codon:yes gene_type:complete